MGTWIFVAEEMALKTTIPNRTAVGNFKIRLKLFAKAEFVDQLTVTFKVILA